MRAAQPIRLGAGNLPLARSARASAQRRAIRMVNALRTAQQALPRSGDRARAPGAIVLALTGASVYGPGRAWPWLYRISMALTGLAGRVVAESLGCSEQSPQHWVKQHGGLTGRRASLLPSSPSADLLAICPGDSRVSIRFEGQNRGCELVDSGGVAVLRLVGEQVESLFDELLPIEVRELPEDLARLDVLLSDVALLEPISERWEASGRGQGRPTIAMSLFVRLSSALGGAMRRSLERSQTRYICGGSADCR